MSAAMVVIAWMAILATLLLSIVVGLVRRRVLWSLVSQILLFKCVAAATFLGAHFSSAGTEDLYMLGYVVSCLVPMFGLVGVVVLFRGARFSSTEEWESNNEGGH